MTRTGVGVDWAGGDWLAVVYEDDEFETATVEDEIDDVWETYGGSDARIAVDVPIGLLSEDDAPDDGAEIARECDEAARNVVGPNRAPSVFNAPAREAIDEKFDEDGAHADVSKRNEEVTGKGLSAQAYGIVDAIGQVDRFLIENDHAPDLSGDTTSFDPFVESHPEVCFRAFAGESLTYPKTSAPGVAERLDVLSTVQPADPAAGFQSVCSELDSTDVSPDDVLDAMALALTACGREQRLHRLPEDPPRDEADLPRQMVYRAPEPILDRSE